MMIKDLIRKITTSNKYNYEKRTAYEIWRQIFEDLEKLEEELK